MGKIIAVTSGKGGSGKTTLTASLGYAFSRMGKSVCLVDACAGLRSLDLMLNAQDRVVYDFADLACDECAMEQALILDTQGVGFVAAPQEFDPERLQDKNVSKTLSRLSKRFDIVLVDVNNVFSTFSQCILRAAHQCVLVLIPGDSALRNTECISSYIHQHCSASLHLFMNCWEKPYIGSPASKAVSSIATYLDIPLIGVLPYTEALVTRRNAVGDYPAKVIKTFDTAATRLLVEDVPTANASERRKKSWHF